MFPDNLTRAEAEQRAALLRATAYAVTVDLTGRDVDDPSHFVSTSALTFSAHAAGRTHLDLIAEGVRSVTLDGRPLDPALFRASRIPLEVEEGEHEVTVTATCRFSRSGEGLHRFVDPVDGRTYLYTQFEVAEARRMFACFEQPDLKARHRMTVLAPSGWTVVSNGAELSQVPVSMDQVGSGLAEWRFAETPPISTYLVALVAGDYHRLTDQHVGEGGEIPMAVLCRQSLAEHLDADRILATTRAGFGVFERHFGVPYPFGKYDQVFVPEYNGGAMENVGCVTLRDEYVFRSRMTPASYTARDDTILHELSHMWFGDLVTMRWWDDLWLKESFATWASNFASAHIHGHEESWASFTNGFKTWAFRQDQLPSTHPIAADMVDLEAVELNFDGITYSKGASVLKQLVASVGEEAFLAGVRGYFAEHAYANTQLTDLLAVLTETSGRDLSDWSAQWLQTAGVNTLTPEFSVGADGTFTEFTVLQSAAQGWPTLRDHRIAVGLYRREPGTISRVGRVEIDVSGSRTHVPELVGHARPDLVLLNDDDLTYAKIRLDAGSLATVRSWIAEIASPLARAVCWASVWDMCRDGELPAVDYVDLVLQGVITETDHTAVRSVLVQAASAARHYTAPATRAAVLQHWQAGIQDLLDRAEAGSDHQLALAKAFPSAAEDATGADRLADWLSGEQLPTGLRLDPELRWSVVTNLARLGRLDADAIAAELARDNTAAGAEHAAAARTSIPSPAAKAEAWRLTTAEDAISNGVQSAICLAFWARGHEHLLEPYVEAYFLLAEDISAGRGVWSTKGMAMRNAALRNLFPVPLDLEAFVVRLDQWLAGRELDPSVRRIVEERRDDALRSLRCQRAA